jgi:hypothetical protein
MAHVKAGITPRRDIPKRADSTKDVGTYWCVQFPRVGDNMALESGNDWSEGHEHYAYCTPVVAVPSTGQERD